MYFQARSVWRIEDVKMDLESVVETGRIVG